MTTKKQSLLMLHIAILMFGSASLFGKLIDQPVFVIVAGRVLFSATITGIYFKVKKIDIRLNSKKDYKIVALAGVLLAVHWLAFYHSVQISTVAITLLTFSTCPIFATFIEPFFFEEKIQRSDIFVAIIAFLGVAVVVPKMEIGNSMFIGVVEGVFAGFSFALISILERKHVKNYKGIVISFYEQVIVFIVLIPFIFISGVNTMDTKEIGTFILFSVVFTLFSRLLYINGLKGSSAQTASVITCLEPIYGIILAIFFFNEIPTARELLGGAIIICAVSYSSIKSLKKDKEDSMQTPKTPEVTSKHH